MLVHVATKERCVCMCERQREKGNEQNCAGVDKMKESICEWMHVCDGGCKHGQRFGSMY